ncbi:MAG TPA: DUF2332 domain-containing protein [Hyphomicrobium sp.]|nr:DUF2332 domain-containing protein [Hyphomicrobium sp.]
MEASIADTYRRFAREEAHGRSPLYEALTAGVADDPDLLAHIADLPPAKQQPNLFLAAARHVNGVPGSWAEFRASTLANWTEIRAVMLARSTQTNEAGRCAALLPVLALLPQPLALLEVGTSAGLCLFPDRYAFDYGSRVVGPVDMSESTPVFPCRADAATPLPDALPRVIWRAGLDISPLDVNDAAQMAWLETLVWPEQGDRLARLRAAVQVARADPPCIRKGDLTRDLSVIVQEAPRDATLVVFHTAVLGYVPAQAQRDAFASEVLQLCDYWISNEAPDVFPRIAAKLDRQLTPPLFMLAVNGHPVAAAHPHGATLDWIADPPRANTGLAE